jgi:transposase
MTKRPEPRETAERNVNDIRRKTRRKFSSEEKIRIVLEGLRGGYSIAELYRREGIAESLYYNWSPRWSRLRQRDFLETGKRRLSGDTARQAASGEANSLKRETRDLKGALADTLLENRLLKKA